MRSSKKFAPQSKAALGRYLAAGLGATGLASMECEAAIVSLNIAALGTPAQNFSGVNAGLGAGVVTNIVNPIPLSVTGGNANAIQVANAFTGGESGLAPFNNTSFLTGSGYASPTNLSDGTLVGVTPPPGSQWSDASSSSNTWFAYYGSESPNFGANSFIGFRVKHGPTSDYTYGYFRVTWNNTSNQFQILSGAYESTPNTPIAVPEPSTIALAGIGALALGAGAIRRSRKTRKAAAEGSLAEAV